MSWAPSAGCEMGMSWMTGTMGVPAPAPALSPQEEVLLRAAKNACPIEWAGPNRRTVRSANASGGCASAVARMNELPLPERRRIMPLGAPTRAEIEAAAPFADLVVLGPESDRPFPWVPVLGITGLVIIVGGTIVWLGRRKRAAQ